MREGGPRQAREWVDKGTGGEAHHATTAASRDFGATCACGATCRSKGLVIHVPRDVGSHNTCEHRANPVTAAGRGSWEEVCLDEEHDTQGAAAGNAYQL